MKLTNLDKEFWPEGLTKAHLIKYYSEVASILLPHIAGRPLVMKRYPDGIKGESFYQKQCPGYAPDWIKTVNVFHRRSGKKVNYIVCDNTATLLWLANQGCIEIHAWLSRLNSNRPLRTWPKSSLKDAWLSRLNSNRKYLPLQELPTAKILSRDRRCTRLEYKWLEYPDIAVMDLDPPEGFNFGKVCQVAVLVRHALKEFGIKSFPKTSGARGMHLFIPLEPLYTFDDVARAMEYIARIVHKTYPKYTTLEKTVKKRSNKIYLDYLQNGRGKTMVFPYSLRPLPGAPVSTPLSWQEVERGGVEPQDFNIKTIFMRLKESGDLFRDFFKIKQRLDTILKKGIFP